MAVMDGKMEANLAWRQFWKMVFTLAREAKQRENATAGQNGPMNDLKEPSAA